MAGTIANGKDTPLNIRTGTIPDVSGVLQDWFQPLQFWLVDKETVGFQVIETTEPLDFFGVIQPLSSRRLMMKPEGQRAWTWLLLHAEPQLKLDVDDVVIYIGVQTRVMARKDNTIYGYVEYELVQDWTGAGPSTIWNGDNAGSSNLNPNLDGGDSNTTQGDVSGGDANGG